MRKVNNTFDGINKTKIEKSESQNIESDLELDNITQNKTEIKTFKSDFNNYVSEIVKNIIDLLK